MEKILLLDGHTVQSISVARSLKEKGYHTIAFIEQKLSYGYVSRYIEKKIICPVLKKDSQKYQHFLYSFLKENAIDIIIPMYNDSAEFLSIHKKEIETQFHVLCAIPEYQTFIKAHNKEFLMNLCRLNNFPHPKTDRIELDRIEEIIQYVGFPALIKPNISSGARGITIVNNAQELIEKFPLISKEFGDCTLQEYIDHTGIYYNVMLYRDKSGICHYPLIIKIMRYFPIKGGTSCYCETVENYQLASICQNVLDSLNWIGFADFDIMESKNGDYKIIEINPRVPASIHAAYISGINYPEIIIKDLTNKQIPSYKTNKNKSMRFGGLDVMWFIFSPKRFSFKPSWFKFFGKNISYQDGSIKDPLPMVMGIISGVLKYLNPSFRKSKLQ